MSKLIRLHHFGGNEVLEAKAISIVAVELARTGNHRNPAKGLREPSPK
jgi:hypothetical protein